MICALLDFEVATEYNNPGPIDKNILFRCKMPNLPSDVPSMMGFELLDAHIRLDRATATYEWCYLYLLDNAENTHNNTLTNEIPLTSMTRKAFSDVIDNGRRLTLVSDNTIKAHKIYISTKQDYLYFRTEDKYNTGSNGYYRVVENAKMIVRLTFDKTQNEYQPKRIML